MKKLEPNSLEHRDLGLVRNLRRQKAIAIECDKKAHDLGKKIEELTNAEVLAATDEVAAKALDDCAPDKFHVFATVDCKTGLIRFDVDD